MIIREREEATSDPVRGNATFYFPWEDLAKRNGLRKTHAKRLARRKNPSDKDKTAESMRTQKRNEWKEQVKKEKGEEGLSAHNGTTLAQIIQSTSSEPTERS